MNTTMELKCVYKHRIRCGANLVCFHFSTDFEVVNFKRSFFEDSVEFAFILMKINLPLITWNTIVTSHKKVIISYILTNILPGVK